MGLLEGEDQASYSTSTLRLTSQAKSVYLETEVLSKHF
jgi:hypothetical protein